MRVGVIHTGAYDRVINRTFNMREWEAYAENSRDISQAIKTLGHDVVNFSDGKDVIASIEKYRIDLAWVCSGGIQGRNSISHLPGILEMLGIPYLGSFPLPLAIADDKATAKKIVSFCGLPTPPFQILQDFSDELDKNLSFPLMVKPITGMCSCGVYRVDTEPDLRLRAEQISKQYRSSILVEKYISGRSVSVPVMEISDKAISLPIVERFFYALDDSTDEASSAILTHPASTLREKSSFSIDLPESVLTDLSKFAIELFKCLDLRHFSRSDFQIDDDYIPYFLEANPKPDLTRNSLFAQAAEKSGIGYEQLIDIFLMQAKH